MARRPEIGYWPTRGTWTDSAGASQKGGFWTTRKGKAIPLAMGPDDRPDGPTYKAAMKAWLALWEQANAFTAGNRNPVRLVLDEYLKALEPTASANTLQVRLAVLREFCKTEMADWPSSRLTPAAVEHWLAGMRRPRTIRRQLPRGKGEVERQTAWGDARVRTAVDTLLAAFHRAVRVRLIQDNPIRGLQAPPARSRSRECVFEGDQSARLIGRLRGDTRLVCVCLANTGARPGEVLLATAADWCDREGALVYHASDRRLAGEGKHKTARKGKTRRILFTGEALAIMRERVAARPRGPLWWNSARPPRPLSIRSLQLSVSTAGKALGLRRVVPYSFRHTYATRWLESGGGIDDLAALLGNTPEIIRRFYSHVAENVGRLRALQEAFSAPGSDSPAVLPFRAAAGQ